MFLLIFNSLGPLGFLPGGGTWSSLVTIFFAYHVGFLDLSFLYQIIAIGSLFALASYSIHRAQSCSYNGENTETIIKDPSEIVIDESVGMLITIIGLPSTSTYMIAGFALFRLLDIYKPWPISYMETFPCTWGVLLDDCVAGLCSCLILQVVRYYV